MFDFEKIYSSGIKFLSKEIENYFIDYIPGNFNKLVITFENADQPSRPRLDGMREPWGADFLGREGYSVLGIKPKRVDWYRGPDLHAFFRSNNFKIFISSFRDIVLYGSSMGGFAALTFAEACPNARVIAFNPQSTLNAGIVPWEHRYPEGRAQDWTGDFADACVGARSARSVYIAYDPLFDLDRKHIDRLTGANLVLFKMPLVGHAVASWMHEAGILSNFINDALSGNLDERKCQELARKRRNAPRYYVGMGLRTRSRSVASACVKKIVDFDISIHHQSDFGEILVKNGLWEFLAEPKTKQKLIKFEENILFSILKKASDSGSLDIAWEICDDYMSQYDPGWPLLVLAAECQHRRGHLSVAKTLALKAIAKDSSVGNCFRILARILYDIGDLPNALQACKQSLVVDPLNFLGRMDLAKYYEALGQFDSALASLKRALEINPNDQIAAARLAKLTSHSKE